MKEQTEYLEDLKEIRSIMERSAKFISLNGISGIFIGIIALIGAAGAYIYSNGNFAETEIQSYMTDTSGHSISDLIQFYMVDAICTLSAAVIISILLTIRKARKKNLPIWDKTCKLLLINLMTPLVVGGIFCLILIYHGFFVLVAPATLLFYGLALYNSSKYTLTGIKYLGLSEMALGLASTLFLGYGFYFWVLGFGFLHIIYGIIYYFTYDRNH
jgi:flagellar biosynthesis component FlhA